MREEVTALPVLMAPKSTMRPWGSLEVMPRAPWGFSFCFAQLVRCLSLPSLQVLPLAALILLPTKALLKAKTTVFQIAVAAASLPVMLNCWNQLNIFCRFMRKTSRRTRSLISQWRSQSALPVLWGSSPSSAWSSEFTSYSRPLSTCSASFRSSVESSPALLDSLSSWLLSSSLFRFTS